MPSTDIGDMLLPDLVSYIMESLYPWWKYKYSPIEFERYGKTQRHAMIVVIRDPNHPDFLMRLAPTVNRLWKESLPGVRIHHKGWGGQPTEVDITLPTMAQWAVSEPILNWALRTDAGDATVELAGLHGQINFAYQWSNHASTRTTI